jgi:hypothetical protein
MKKLLVLLALGAGVAGCGAPASQSEMWRHDTLYRNLDHLRFSWGGHKSISTDEVKQSMEEAWWGKPIPVAPRK